MEDLSDQISRARQGDRAAFAALVRPLIEPGCQLAFTFLHDWEDAEDVVQDACLKAWQAIGHLRDETTTLRPWFLTIVANGARSKRRSRWWSVIRTAEPPEGGHRPRYEDTVALRTDLDAAMRRLTETERTILFLHFYLDLPLDEIGHILGMSKEAVKSRMYRATRSLRPALTLEEVGS